MNDGLPRGPQGQRKVSAASPLADAAYAATQVSFAPGELRLLAEQSLELFAFVRLDLTVHPANAAFSNRFAPAQGVHRLTIDSVFGAYSFHREFRIRVEQAFCGNDREEEYFVPNALGLDTCYRVSFIPCREGSTIHSVLLRFQDVSELRRLKEKIATLEFKDRRTGLPNRKALDLVLEKEVARARRSRKARMMALLYINLENFARINQTYGHEIGDILLENSGIRIKETIISELLREGDYVFESETPKEGARQIEEEPPSNGEPGRLLFRFEGKEFIALLADITRETDAALVAMRIVKHVSLPYRDSYGSEIFIHCNIGIAMFPSDGSDRETLVYHAASAMQEAKRLREEFLLFNKGLHEKALQKMRLGGSIYSAFIESQFELYYQPVVDYLGDIVGAEALIRWNHPERGVVSPSEFIPLAVEKGIIINIGKWTLYQVCKQLERLPRDIYVSFNLSARELEHSQVVDNILRVVRNAQDVDPRQVKIEITESDSMLDPDATIRKIGVLRENGVDVMIDDFGTGQSSLQYLKRLPASTLKIARAFVQDVVDSIEERRFLESIVDLAYSRGKAVVIEGIETREQLDVVRLMKPALIQGFFFSEPVPARAFEELVSRRVRLPVGKESSGERQFLNTRHRQAT